MAHLPSGTVTLLFTDIEGSTRLLQHLGERYAEVLAEHQRLLREAFAAHGGREVDTQGDAFFVAFPRALDAVQSAVAAQRALAARLWPEGAAGRAGAGRRGGGDRQDRARRGARPRGIGAGGAGGDRPLLRPHRDTALRPLARGAGRADRPVRPPAPAGALGGAGQDEGVASQG